MWIFSVAFLLIFRLLLLTYEMSCKFVLINDLNQ